jgi:nitrate reductase assembly molybdenum cofactor insertion protein NarJ
MWPDGSVEKALEDLATALVPVAHDLRYGLPTTAARRSLVEVRARALLDAGGRLADLDEEYAHLADALRSVWGS